MKCFYHNDMDGKCAGFWVLHGANIHDKYRHQEKPQMIAIDYKDRFPLEIIRPDEQIYIVDFSIHPDEMRELLKITKDVTWIDHHITAIEKYKDFEHNIRGIRFDGIAGCELTWIYLFLLTKLGEGPIKKVNPSVFRDSVPLFTRLIGDRDVWQWKFGKRTKNFYAGLELYDTNPESPVWFAAMEDTMPFEEKGKIVEQYKKIHRKELIKAFAFETKFEGYNCIACNVGKTSSELFDSVEKDYDIMIPFVFDGKQWTVSLYSNKVDVSKIAKKYGGGGHKGAAGFQCKELPFTVKS